MSLFFPLLAETHQDEWMASQRLVVGMVVFQQVSYLPTYIGPTIDNKIATNPTTIEEWIMND